MQKLEEIDLGDADVAVRPVKVGGQRYVLREMSYEAETRRTAAIRRNSVYGEDGKWTGFRDGVTALDSNRLTLSLCMFRNVGDNGDCTCGEPVAEETIQGWPSEIVFRLNDMVVELCPTLQNLDTVDGVTKEMERLAKAQLKLQERLAELQGKDAAKN